MDIVPYISTLSILLTASVIIISNGSPLNNSARDSVNIRQIKRRSAVLDAQIWPNGIIPYTVSASITAMEARFLCKAMMNMEHHTCVKFEPLTQQTKNNHFLFITNDGPFCGATVGFDANKVWSPFFINLAPRCYIKRGVVEHELLHVIGLYHEQSRHDRDKYVKINFGGIEAAMVPNFEVISSRMSRTFGLPYDVNSVMHYPSHAFSISRGIPTIISKVSPDTILGQREGPTLSDYKKVYMMYSCDKAGTPAISTFGSKFKTKLAEFMSIKRDPNFDKRMLWLIRGVKEQEQHSDNT